MVRIWICVDIQRIKLFIVYLCNRGDTKRSMKQYADAAEDYKLAFAADPNYARAYNALGNANVRTEL